MNKDMGAIKELIKEYESNKNTISIRVETVTEKILRDIIDVCDVTKHMKEVVKHYDDEKDESLNTWEDIEGEGYGWIWRNHPEEKWHDALRDLLLEFMKDKKKSIKSQKETVLIIEMKGRYVYHFVERESLMQDTIYSFSNKELGFWD